MANEPKVPEAKDDDPDEVADKLSIAAAMWSRGDRADALSWVRRAAESASDAELDMRALELAKAASALATEIAEVAAAEAAPAASPSNQPPAAAVAPPSPPPSVRPPTAPPARPQTQAPAAPAQAPTASAAPRPTGAALRPSQTQAPGRTAPASATKSVTTAPRAPALPGSRPPGGKLPPLPPMRPLGSAPEKPPTKSASARLPSIITSASGVNNAAGMSSTASGTIDRESEPEAPPAQMPWDDDEETHQVSLRDGDVQLQGEPPLVDPESTAVYAATDLDRLKRFERASRGGEPAVAAPAAAAPGPPKTPPPVRSSAAPLAADARSTFEPPLLPLAVGIRVRIVTREGALQVVPDTGQSEGVAAILLPASADDDLRPLFGRARS